MGQRESFCRLEFKPVGSFERVIGFYRWWKTNVLKSSWHGAQNVGGQLLMVWFEDKRLMLVFNAYTVDGSKTLRRAFFNMDYRSDVMEYKMDLPVDPDELDHFVSLYYSSMEEMEEWRQLFVDCMNNESGYRSAVKWKCHSVLSVE